MSDRAVVGTCSATARCTSAAFEPSISPVTDATTVSGPDLLEAHLGQPISHQHQATYHSIAAAHPDRRSRDPAVDLERIRELLDQREPAAARAAARRAPRAEVRDLDRQLVASRLARTAKWASPGG